MLEGFREIAACTGGKSQEKKVGIIRRLLLNCAKDGSEVKFLVRGASACVRTFDAWDFGLLGVDVGVLVYIHVLVGPITDATPPTNAHTTHRPPDEAPLQAHNKPPSPPQPTPQPKPTPQHSLT